MLRALRERRWAARGRSLREVLVGVVAVSERWHVEEHMVETDGSVTRRTASFDAAYPDDGVTLTKDVEERVRAELHDLRVLELAAAPDPEDIIATMRANGLIDPEREQRQ